MAKRPSDEALAHRTVSRHDHAATQMTRKDPKLSYQEMDAILKRSAELQARRGSTEFSEQDVLDAAKELGIDQKTAANVIKRHLARRATAAELVPRPFNTRIQLEVSPDVLSLTIPPVRASRGDFAQLGFSVAWLSCISFFTFAMREHLVFTLFLLPFWWVGFGGLGGAGLPLIRKTTLRLNRDGGELAVSPLGRRRALRTTQLRVHHDEEELLLDHGVDTIPLMFGHSPQEQRWIESELRAWLHNV